MFSFNIDWSLFFHTNFILLRIFNGFTQIPFITKSETPGWYGGPELSHTSLLPRFIYKTYLIIERIVLLYFFHIDF